MKINDVSVDSLRQEVPCCHGRVSIHMACVKAGHWSGDLQLYRHVMQAPKSLPYSGRVQEIERRVQGSSVVSKHKKEACVQAKACPMIASEALRL